MIKTMRNILPKWALIIAAAAAAAFPAELPAAAGAEAQQQAEQPVADEKPAREAVTDGSSPFVRQGLTIFELEKELERLKKEKSKLDAEMAELEEEIERQQVSLKQKQEAAGKVLRAYYMGQRDHLWMLLLRIRSLNEVLAVLDYLQAIAVNDFKTLQRYRLAYEERLALLAEHSSRQDRLRVVIEAHETQRIRLLKEQAELDRRLAELAEEEREAHLAAIAAAAREWEEIGVPLFEEVLTALSGAMADLPELLSDPSMIVSGGQGLEIRLTDEAFNAYLAERNPLFESFRFQFTPEGMTVFGEAHGRTASLSGKYILEHEPENALRFEIEGVCFQETELPDTTITAMQETYSLTFEPGRLMPGLSVSELSHEEGAIRVKLSFALF